MSKHNYPPQVVEEEEFLKDIRRHLHQYPELRWEEFETSKFLKEKLKSYGLELQENIAKTGFVAILRGTKEKPCIALRADMDALPILERTGLEFASKNEGKMHACGHDAHMSSLLTAAKILSREKDKLNGTVKFIFQPAEEGGSGADVMVKEGALTCGGVDVDQVYGIHVWSQCKTGVVAIKDGPFMAGCRMLQIDVQGKGGHAAQPQVTTDAVLISTSLVQALHTIISRNVDPFESAVLTIGKIESGYAENVIADQARISGTIRFMTKEVEKILRERVESICSGFSIAYNAKITPSFSSYYPPVINTYAEGVKLIKEVSSEIVGKENITSSVQSMASEDFSFFLEQRPGAFFFVGCGEEPFDESNPPAPHHRPTFMVNEEAMKISTSIFINLVRKLMK